MDEKFTEIVSQFKSSGLAQKEFCEQQNIPLSTLRYYLYKKGRRIKSENKSDYNGSFISLSTANASDKELSIVIVRGRMSIDQVSDIINQVHG